MRIDSLLARLSIPRIARRRISQDPREIPPKINKSPLDLRGTARVKPGVIAENEFDGNPKIGFRLSVLCDCLEIRVTGRTQMRESSDEGSRPNYC